MRKLASIQRIWKIEPIEGADRIELAHVLGWNCVVNKDQFKEMDLAVYFEVDSFLPIRDEYEFLRKSCYRKTDVMGEGFKLRTQCFKKQISQGLLLPISLFPEIPENYQLGDDITDILKVRKWEVEQRISTSGNIKTTLPGFIPHTDETRIQTKPELLNEFKNLEYYISTKMDGSSHSVGIDEEGIHVTGHNYEYYDDGSSPFYEYLHKNNYLKSIRDYYEDKGYLTFVIQGELCAPGIQKNRLKLIKPEWYVFTIIVNGKRLGLDEMTNVCHELKLNMVPIEERNFDLPNRYPSIDDLLNRADGEYPNGGKKEGIVIRPCEPVYCQLIYTNLSMKIINNKYLLKNEE